MSPTLIFSAFCCCTSDRVVFSVFSVLLRCYTVLLFLSFGKSLVSRYNLVKILVSWINKKGFIIAFGKYQCISHVRTLKFCTMGQKKNRLYGQLIVRGAHEICVRKTRVTTNANKYLKRFVSYFIWMFLQLTPTKFVKAGVLPLFFMELWVILFKFWPILK